MDRTLISRHLAVAAAVGLGGGSTFSAFSDFTDIPAMQSAPGCCGSTSGQPNAAACYAPPYEARRPATRFSGVD